VVFHPVGADPVRDLFAGEFPTAAYEPVAPSYRSPGSFVANSFRLAREFRRNEITLVHCADILAAYFAGYAARMARIPLLCHVRNRYDRISARDRSFLAPVQKFAFVSRDTWTHFAHRVRESRGCVLYDGIDLPDTVSRAADRDGVRREFGISADASVIGMVARVAPQKDYLTLVRAASEVVKRFPTACFLIVGDCSSTAANRDHLRGVQNQLEAAGLTRHFIFTDYRRDVPRFLNAMDIFVLSTHWEGLPLVLLEAMAHGLPVVATAVDGVPEIVVSDRSGLLHAHEDAEGLAAGISALLAAPDRARQLGEAARTHVSEGFGRDAFARNLASIYLAMHRVGPLQRTSVNPDRGELAATF
jgi:glycosyltransferase involved in cell wall biosynthesis